MQLLQPQQSMKSIATITVFSLVSTVLSVQPTQAQDRHQNTYGLGLDLHWYCSYQYGDSASLYMEEQSAYGFRCLSGGRVMSIDMNHVCQLMYGPSHQAVMANASQMGSWYCTDRSARSTRWDSPQPRSRSRSRSRSRNTRNRSFQSSQQTLIPQVRQIPESNISTEPAGNLRALDSELLSLTNAQRQNDGKPPLRFSSRLAQAAQAYAEDYSRHPNLPPHTGSDGSSVGDRVNWVGYTFSWVGENAYTEAPNSSPASAIRWWMSSPGHRANILQSGFTEVGFGYAYDPSTRIHSYIQVFGTPSNR
jgi:uncharacterized protein YkwD